MLESNAQRWPLFALVGGLGLLLWVSRQARWQPLFRWLPVPLWCYGLPMLAATAGWLPSHPAALSLYQSAIALVLPVALLLLLASVNLPAVVKLSGPAALAATAGALSIMLAAASGAWLLRDALPPEAWTGAGSLTGTWTGGTMNLLSLRAIFGTPDAVFAPLVIVDAIVAYGWMAILVGLSGLEPGINRWLRATPLAVSAVAEAALERPSRQTLALGCGIAIAIVWMIRRLAPHLPATTLINSASGWTVFLITTVALLGSWLPAVRRVAAHTAGLGYAGLYLVLAATGAQAQFRALLTTPAWLLVGAWVVLVHGATLLVVGRLARVPLSVLATASQANIGGVVSAPLVGAVYHRSLAPVGLVLAMAGNALGTYLGLATAMLAKWLLT